MSSALRSQMGTLAGGWTTTLLTRDCELTGPLFSTHVATSKAHPLDVLKVQYLLNFDRHYVYGKLCLNPTSIPTNSLVGMS